ncbi:SDR family oxidoreductase [Algiphilus aromaticivorans]|uniref:SDR family oxidoreductase n=1 Tax=Algiphilus aromaticivorans TaxID=382454 RepID=UPI00069341F5|nr:SDR family oxidoreductase [Algiphilus aromaticivorans]
MSEPSPVAFVTGSARRIGAEIARRLHRDGWHVVLHCRGNRAEAEALRDDLLAARADSAELVVADFAQAGAAATAVREAAGVWGRLDALVNNASSYKATPLTDLRPEQTEDLLASNLKAPLEAAQAFAKQAGAAAIVNIIDTLVRHVRPGYAPYFAAKSGLWTLTEALALELAPAIRVNGVAPGHILWATNSSLDEAEQAAERGRIPLQRLGTPEAIASAVAYLLSAEADYVTGAVLPVDGGLRLA